MARPVYSTLFVAETIPSGSTGGGIVPLAGQTMVVRDIEYWTEAAGIGNLVRFYVGSSVNPMLEYTFLTAGHNTSQWTGRIVIPYGFTAIFQAMIGAWNVCCSGYVLTDP